MKVLAVIPGSGRIQDMGGGAVYHDNRVRVDKAA